MGKDGVYHFSLTSIGHGFMRNSKEHSLAIHLGMVSFFTDISTEMMKPIIPPFIVEVLKGSRLVLGLISGLAEAISYALRLVAGVLAGITRKYWALTALGYSLSTFSKPLIGVAPTWHWAALTVSTDRVGKAIRTPARDTLLSASTRKEILGKIFGIHRFLDQMGAVIGPLTAAFLLWYLALNYRFILYLTIIPGISSLIILYLTYRKFKGYIELKPRTTSLHGIKVAARTLLPVLLLVSIYGLSYLHINFLIDRARVGFLFADYIVVLLYMVAQLFHALAGLYFGRLFDKLGLLVMYFSVIFLALSSITSLYTLFPVLIVFSFMFYGLQEGVHEVSWRALIGKIVSQELKSLAYGLYHMVFGFSILTGSLIVGFLYEVYGYYTAILYVITLNFVTIAILTYVLRKGLIKY